MMKAKRGREMWWWWWWWWRRFKREGECAMEASHLEGPHVPDLTSTGHDHGPRDLGKGRKRRSKGGRGGQQLLGFGRGGFFLLFGKVT